MRPVVSFVPRPKPDGDAGERRLEAAAAEQQARRDGDERRGERGRSAPSIDSSATSENVANRNAADAAARTSKPSRRAEP